MERLEILYTKDKYFTFNYSLFGLKKIIIAKENISGNKKRNMIQALEQ